MSGPLVKQGCSTKTRTIRRWSQQRSVCRGSQLLFAPNARWFRARLGRGQLRPIHAAYNPWQRETAPGRSLRVSKLAVAPEVHFVSRSLADKLDCRPTASREGFDSRVPCLCRGRRDPTTAARHSSVSLRFLPVSSVPPEEFSEKIGSGSRVLARDKRMPLSRSEGGRWELTAATPKTCTRDPRLRLPGTKQINDPYGRPPARAESAAAWRLVRLGPTPPRSPEPWPDHCIDSRIAPQ